MKKRTCGILRYLFHPVLLPVVIPAILALGCATGERHSYNSIRAEYAARGVPGGGGPGRPGDALPPGGIDLKGAIVLVLAANPEIQKAAARIGQSRAMVEQARAAFWPVISTYGNYTQGDAPSAYLFKTIDQRNLPAGVNFNDPGWFENYEVGIRGRLNLYNGGRDHLRTRMAESELRARTHDREETVNTLIASAIQNFYQALAAREYIEIAEESAATVASQLRIMQVRYEAGGALRSDVLSLGVRLAQAKEDLLRARNAYNLSRAALANLLNVDPDTPLALKERGGLPGDLPGSYQEGLVYALDHRPELLRLRERAVQSRTAVDLARSGRLPRLDVEATYYMDDPDPAFDRDRENWNAGLKMRWDIFTGFSTRAEVRKAEALLKEILAADQEVTNAVLLELKMAYLKLEEAAARLEVSRASIEEARESLRLVKRQYEGGSATITRYLNAELAHNRARIRAASAYYDHEQAWAELGRALGYWGDYAREVHPGHG